MGAYSVMLLLISLLAVAAVFSTSLKRHYDIISARSSKINKNHNPEKRRKNLRGHTELNHGPLYLQSNALPLSYTPYCLLQKVLELSLD